MPWCRDVSVSVAEFCQCPSLVSLVRQSLQREEGWELVPSRGEERGSREPLDLEDLLWKAAEMLRGSMDVSEYKHVVLSLIFLKYVGDTYEQRRETLRDELAAGGITGARADELLDSSDQYTAAGTFWVPPQARWGYLREHARDPEVGKLIDSALDLIELHNPVLRGMQSETHVRPTLDAGKLGELVDLISGMGGPVAARRRENDIYESAYQYLLGRFASRNTSGGAFYTPRSVVRLLVEMLEPYSGSVYDPCCGSGGLLIHADRFVKANDGHRDDIAAYGQELDNTAWQLAMMNLMLNGIEADLGPRSGSSFHQNMHPDLMADFIFANPPFNISGWDRDQFRDVAHWEYGIPPASNANFAWLQHIVSRLSPRGIAGVVLPNGSASSQQPGEARIRRRMIEADLIACIVALPGQLFYSTRIPVTLWFLKRDKAPNGVPHGRDRRGETLFIDARNFGVKRDRKRRKLTDEHVARISDTYHAWRGVPGTSTYVDVPDFCASVTIEAIAQQQHVLVPAYYVGAEDPGHDEPLAGKTVRLTQGPGSGCQGEQAAWTRSIGAEMSRMTGLLGTAPSNWEYLTLGELRKRGNGSIQAGQSGSQLHASDYVTAGIPIVMPANIGDNRISANSIARITQADAERLERYRLRAGDIVCSRRGTVDRRALVRDGEEGWLCGTGSIRIRPGSAVDSKWLSYYLGHPRVRAWMVRHAVGTTMPHLNSDILSALPVLVPPASEQQAIAKVLNSLDEKIRINERLHDQCHNQASALLIRLLDEAKSDGTLERGRLGDVGALNARNVTPGAGTLRYLNISAVGMGRADEPSVMRWAKAPRQARRGVKDGDILWSTVRPNRKAHCLVLDPAPDLVVSTAFAVLTPISVGPSFLYGMTEQSEFVDYLVSVAKGTPYPTVRPERFLHAPLPLPSRDKCASFEESTMPLRRRAIDALTESTKLAALRDTLLPPLLSGQLRGHDAELLIEDSETPCTNQG